MVARGIVLYNMIIPAIALFFFHRHAVFSNDVLVGMGLCMASAGGTSAGAFMTPVRGLPQLAGTLIIGSVLGSLFSIMLYAQIGWIPLGDLSFVGLGVYLLCVTVLPFVVGKTIRQRAPQWSDLWQPRIDKVGGILVLLLILVLAILYAKPILTGPAEPMVAAWVAVAIFGLPPLLERHAAQRRTLAVVTVIRNLTLVLSIVAVLPHASGFLPTILAYGLFQYITTGLWIWKWRTIEPDRASTVGANGDD